MLSRAWKPCLISTGNSKTKEFHQFVYVTENGGACCVMNFCVVLLLEEDTVVGVRLSYRYSVSSFIRTSLIRTSFIRTL